MSTSSQSSTSLYHNSWYSSGTMLTLPQGNSVGARAGDEVFLQALVCKLHFNSKPDRQAQMIRAMLVKVPTEHATTAATALFTGGSNNVLTFPDRREVQILDQKIVRMQGNTVWSTSNDDVKKDLNATVVLKAKFYNARTYYDYTDPKHFRVRLLIVAYDSHGTLTTDNIADFEMCSRLYFKDP